MALLKCDVYGHRWKKVRFWKDDGTTTFRCVDCGSRMSWKVEDFTLDDGTRLVESAATDPTLDSSRTGSTGTKN